MLEALLVFWLFDRYFPMPKPAPKPKHKHIITWYEPGIRRL